MKNVLPGTSLILLLLWLTACATTPSSGPRRSANLLTADEIAEAGVLTAADAIQRLRPQWLQNRSSPTFRSTEGVPPMLYLDGIRMDGLRELERIRATAVAEIRYMNPTDATNRYGTDHVGGAILVTTR